MSLPDLRDRLLEHPDVVRLSVSAEQIDAVLAALALDPHGSYYCAGYERALARP